MTGFRVIVIVVIPIFGMCSTIACAQVLDANGDGTVGPHEALELSRQWKESAATIVDSSQFLRRDVSDEFVGPKLIVDGALDVGIEGTSSHDVNIFGASAGSRLFWDESLGALRAGRANGDEWNPDNVGLNSIALGYNTNASGDYSTAMGRSTTASGNSSTAMGVLTTASGTFSIALGQSTTASGRTSTALGYGAIASGRTSTAIGMGSIASGHGSFAVGSGFVAVPKVGGAPFFFGSEASGMNSTAIGHLTNASGFNSTALGDQTAAGGDFSTAMGSQTTASNSYSTAMGRSTTASGYNSTAMGYDTTASGPLSTAMGDQTTASGDGSTAMGSETTASGGNSIAMGIDTIASGETSIAMGRGIEAKGDYAVAIALNEQIGTVVANDHTMAIVGGNVGIGSLTPTTRLHVEDDVAGFVLSVSNDGSEADRAGIVIQAGSDDGSGTTDYLLALDGDGDPVGALRANDGTFSLIDLSDRLSKSNIRDTEVDALGIIENLRVVDFNRKSMPDGPTIHGFIAQEAQEVFPEMVTQLNKEMLGISKDALIPVFAKAFQEQEEKFEKLQKQIEEQREEIATLKALIEKE